MLVLFSEDSMIHPKETAHFMGVNENDDVVDLKESEFYKNDLIGLRALNE